MRKDNLLILMHLKIFEKKKNDLSVSVMRCRISKSDVFKVNKYWNLKSVDAWRIYIIFL